MEFNCIRAIFWLCCYTSVWWLCLCDAHRPLCSLFEQNNCNDKETFCFNDFNAVELKHLPDEVANIKYIGPKVICNSIDTKKIIELKKAVTIEGNCIDSSGLAKNLCEYINELEDKPHKRRTRRNVIDPESKEKNTNPSVPGGIPLLPCNFDSDICQWYQLSDSDFKWTRKSGPTPSSDTGPSSDHTSGKGYYIYIETSIPRKLNDKARLVSPTLRPVPNNKTCNVTFFLHMYGSHIGQLNIYQAPVIGHHIIKKSFSSSQANAWVQENVVFDSSREFQIIIEGVRGQNYQGDIAIDDITFSSGCQRLQTAYVRYIPPSAVFYLNGTWGNVCYSGWTKENSGVFCKQLGYKSANQTFGSPMNALTMTGYENISCSGSEQSIEDCKKGVWSNTTTCPNNNTASVQCIGISPVCPLKTHFYCPKKTNESTPKCVSESQRCDFIDDCWDGSDETNCDNYTRCTFEDPGICGWKQALNDQLNWTRHSGNTPSINTGPTADHKGNTSAYYMFVEVSHAYDADKGLIAVNHRFQGNHEGQCKLRFFYHMYGWSTGRLRVVINDLYSTFTIWEKVGSFGHQWNRAEITLMNTTRSFQVMFEAEHTGRWILGDIAIDDVSFTPECRPAPLENVTCSEDSFKCISGECIPLRDQCDFMANCFDASDERSCGRQPGRNNFEDGLGDWTNDTDGDVFEFTRHSGRTPSMNTGPSYDHTLGPGKNGYYLYIEASSPRKRNDNAKLSGPQVMWAGIQNCQMRFFYHMWSGRNYYYVGTLKVMLRNVITLEMKTLWQRTGNQGNRWFQADVPITTNWPVVQIVLDASVGYSYESDIAIDDISFSPQCYPDTPAHVDKNYDVRLVGQKSSYKGRVEIYRVGTWGTICNGGWDQKDVTVVCKQLGYGGGVNMAVSAPAGKGQIWLDNLKCFGNESNLSMCKHKGWSVHDCSHDNDATAYCDISIGGSTIPLRLAGYTSDPMRGVVEVKYRGIWGSVCFDDWDLHDAHVACRQAGFLGIERVTKETVPTVNNIMLSNVNCTGSEDSLGKCRHSGFNVAKSCRYGYAGVVCRKQSASEGDLKLVGGRSFKEGRVEIFHSGEWGTVCEDKWRYQDAQVVCFELGFTGVTSYLQSFGPGTGRIWLHDVKCHGNESTLSSCPGIKRWGSSPCRHDEDVGVICSDEPYVGCYKDGAYPVMPHKKTMKGLTPVKCLKYCRYLGYAYCGLHWGTDCFCGSHYNKYGNASNEACSSPCDGDPSKYCGGPQMLSVYSTDIAIIPSSAPGWMPVRQSCSSVYYFNNFISLAPIAKPNYFRGNHSSGSIWSPNWPNNYPNRIHCVWVINLLPGSKARIKFTSYDLETGYDTIEARDGKRNYDTKLIPSGGYSKSTVLTASTNVMWIRFYADKSVTRKGFKIEYEAYGLMPSTTPRPVYTTLPTTLNPSDLPNVQMVIGGCNNKPHTVNITFGYFDQYHSTGYIKSPGYPGSYGNQVCNWTIVVQIDFRLNIAIQKMSFLSSEDELIIDDGVTKQSSRHHKPPWSFKSFDRMVRVAFVTKSTSRRKRDVKAVGFYMTYEREPKDKGSFAKQEKDGNGLGGGSIAGIVIGFIVLAFIIVILVFLLIKSKKKRSNQPARHFFVNQAYDNTDGMNMASQTNGTLPPSGLQDDTVFYANTAVAPPPYTPQAGLTDAAPEYAAPSAPAENPGYGNLYSHPPPYRPPTAERGVTTTGIGSVTNLRDVDNSSQSVTPDKQVTVLTPLDGSAASGGNMFGVKNVLPPITVVGTQEKTPLPTDTLQSDQAGPLPEKMPIDVAPTNNNLPPANATRGPLQGQVTRSQASSEFDVEVPFEFLCPISNGIMKHPVSASDGYTYERRAIRSWFRRNQTSPMTNEKLTDLSVRPNEHLETRIKEFVQAHKV